MQEFKNFEDPGEWPWVLKFVQKPLMFLDRFFDRLYTSRYNPLYRSGTLAVYCLFAALITGFYLIFFYRISAPYESIVEIHSQVWGGRWIRTMHRWVSDVAVVAVIFHIFRLLVQGKTWGQRILAWLTGVFLTALMFISAWTGYVMVWDEHGLALARMGAEILDHLHIFPESMLRAFTGDRPILGAFFFMNLFLHVAVPLGMIVVLWLHTFKLARPKWFPERRVTVALSVIFIAFSALVSAPLLKPADLLAIPGVFPTDLFYNFWMPIQDRTSSLHILILFFLGTIFLASVPLWWKPRSHHRRTEMASSVDKNRCQGCSQCYWDCPFDAITMKKRGEEGKPDLYSDVAADLCTSCGICAASCESLAIGPAKRTGLDLLQAVQSVMKGHKPNERKGVLFVCEHSDLMTPSSQVAKEAGWLTLPVSCVGSLHASVFGLVVRRYGHAAVAGCPEQNCRFREGPFLLRERLNGQRQPAPPENIQRDKIFVFQGSRHEASSLWAFLRNPESQVQPTPDSGFQLFKIGQIIVGALSTILILWGVSAGSQYESGHAVEHGAIRLGWRLPGQKIETCRDLSDEEVAKQLAHMRRTKECKTEYLKYSLQVWANEKLLFDKRVAPSGFRHDRPLDVSAQLSLDPGDYSIRVLFTPEVLAQSQSVESGHSAATREASEPAGVKLEFDGRVQIVKGRVALITLDSTANRLWVKTQMGATKP